MKKLRFYNHPKSLTLAHYDGCYKRVLSQLIERFPSTSIFKVGGKDIKPGLSDLDLLIVAEEPINGNLVYLRDLHLPSNDADILVHEPFAIDLLTYTWLNRLTSYTIEQVYSPEGKGLPKILKGSGAYSLLKLCSYVVANYPANFLEFKQSGEINVRRSISKLKKLFNLESLFREVFDNELEILNSNFRSALHETVGDHAQFNVDEMNDRVYELLTEAEPVMKNMFELFDAKSRDKFDLNMEPNELILNDRKLVFSDNWRDNLYVDGRYFLPGNLSLIIGMFKHIDPSHLRNIEYAHQVDDMEVTKELGEVVNKYLGFCNKSKLLTLIFDINYSVFGHDSLKYLLFSRLGKIKRTLISAR